MVYPKSACLGTHVPLYAYVESSLSNQSHVFRYGPSYSHTKMQCLNRSFESPLALLSLLKHLKTLFGQVWLATVASDVLEVYRLPGLFIGFTLAGLLALLFLKLDLDLGGLGKLLGVDSIGDS